MRATAAYSLLLASSLLACQSSRTGGLKSLRASPGDLIKARDALRDDGLYFDLEYADGQAGARIEHWMHEESQILLHHVPNAPAVVLQRWWVRGPPSLRATESALRRQRSLLPKGASTDVFFSDDLAYAQLIIPVGPDLSARVSSWLKALPVGPAGGLMLSVVGGPPRIPLLRTAAQVGMELVSGASDLPTPIASPLDALSVGLRLSPANLADATGLETVAEVLGAPQNGPLTENLERTGAQWIEVETRVAPKDAELTVRFGPLHAVSATVAITAVTRAVAAVARGETARSRVRHAVSRLQGRQERRWARAEGRARMMAETLWAYGTVTAVNKRMALLEGVEERDLRSLADRLLAIPARVRP